MKLMTVISTDEPETVWNAFRLGVTSLKANHKVKAFLMNKGVEVEDIEDEKYNVREQINLFIKNKGEMLACGTCLKSRHKKENDICPVSTMKDLLKLVEESDKVLTFG